MKNLHLFLTVAAAAILSAGCRTNYGAGSPYQPGPVAGKIVGNAVGEVGGNVAGFGVGLEQGAVHGMEAPFNKNYHMVRYWKTETTPDGRTIQVPEDVLVDQYGQPAVMPAPTGNSAPSSAQPAPPPPQNYNAPMATPPETSAPTPAPTNSAGR